MDFLRSTKIWKNKLSFEFDVVKLPKAVSARPYCPKIWQIVDNPATGAKGPFKYYVSEIVGGWG